jgi:hypothetical protein
MAKEPATDEVVLYRVKELLPHCQLEFIGNLLPGTIAGTLTPEGIRLLCDYLDVRGIKFTEK